MQQSLSVLSVCMGILFLGWHASGSQETNATPSFPFQVTAEVPGLDTPARTPPGKRVSGPIAPSSQQPGGALAGHIIFTSGGHGWAWNGSSWSLGRPVLNQMNEDYGNLDQMSLFAYYCFNAGATVVPFRPIGNQTNEVVLDNTSPQVTWAGTWENSSSTVYYGAPGAMPYRFAAADSTQTAAATYAPAFPASGFYPVYTWALHGANRINQLYRIRHAGGESSVRIPHHMVGNGWVYLGTYYFQAGRNPSSGAVIISNEADGQQPSGVVIADAIRFGNGMGNINRGGGVSTYPREEEAARYWIQAAVGQGQSTTLYDNPGSTDSDDNVGAPIRMAAEMNREAKGAMAKRLYVSFHSNAGGGRGVTALYNNPALSPSVAKNSNTPNQLRLAQLLGTEVNGDLANLGGFLETPWYNRGSDITFARSDYAFGEINNNTISNEFDATIVEVAFHDNASDARLMRDPKVRNWVARATYQGVVRYMNQFDAAPLVFLPEPPSNVRVMGSNDTVILNWATPIAQGGAGSPAGYAVYASTNGYGFGAPILTTGLANSAAVPGLAPGIVHYFRVTATNSGGESLPSETVACRLPLHSASSRVLFVNGFTRFERNLNLRQTPQSGQYRLPGHDQNTGTIDRVMPRQVNSFDYVVPHAQALAEVSSMALDSCQVQALTNGTVSLTNYQVLIWGAGNQSSADRTFNSAAQQQVAAFLAGGGHLLVSGAEIAWDLDRPTGPTAADRDFLKNVLHASLGSAANDDSGVYQFAPVATAPFAGLPAGTFDDGTQGIYSVGYPDALVPTGQGASAALNYPGYSGGAAGVFYDASAGGGKVVYLGFPFETITSSQMRGSYMARILDAFSRQPVISSLVAASPTVFEMAIQGEPGAEYHVESSPDLVTWHEEAQVSNPSGHVTVQVPRGAGSQFFRVRVQ